MGPPVSAVRRLSCRPRYSGGHAVSIFDIIEHRDYIVGSRSVRSAREQRQLHRTLPLKTFGSASSIIRLSSARINAAWIDPPVLAHVRLELLLLHDGTSRVLLQVCGADGRKSSCDRQDNWSNDHSIAQPRARQRGEAGGPRRRDACAVLGGDLPPAS